MSFGKTLLNFFDQLHGGYIDEENEEQGQGNNYAVTLLEKQEKVEVDHKEGQNIENPFTNEDEKQEEEVGVEERQKIEEKVSKKTIAPIALVGKRFFNDLINEVKQVAQLSAKEEKFDKEKFKEALEKRFFETLTRTVTSIESTQEQQEDRNKVDVLDEQHQNNIKGLINIAVDKLAEEMEKLEKTSLDKKEKELNNKSIMASIVNTLGQLCRFVGKSLGLAKANAAELFEEAAKKAMEIKETIAADQIERDQNNYEAARKAGFIYNPKIRENDKRSVEDIKKELQEHHLNQMQLVSGKVEKKYGIEALTEVSKRGYKNIEVADYQGDPLVPARSYLQSLDKYLDSSKKDENSQDIPQTSIYSSNPKLKKLVDAMETVLFSKAITIGNNTYYPKLEVPVIRAALDNLGKEISKSKDDEAQKLFNQMRENLTDVKFRNLKPRGMSH